MTRSLAALLLSVALTAYAQNAPPEPVQEPANMVTIIAFLVLFFGSIVGYIVYLAWQAKKKHDQD